MKFKYEVCKGKDLKPGDLFANAKPEELEKMLATETGGVGLFVKTNLVLDIVGAEQAVVTRVKIVKGKAMPKKYAPTE